MNFYDRLILPRLLDCLCGLPDITAERAKLVPRAHGRVLEIGIGTGLNLPHYDAGKVQQVHGVDPAPQMQKKALQRAARTGIAVETVPLMVEQIGAAAASYDCVVCTFTLCTIADGVSALREMRRVLKPGGELLFCEHGRAPDAGVRRWQQRLNPVWGRIAGGCQLHRDVPQLLKDGGFRVQEMERKYLPGPRPWTYLYAGSAVAA
ncbi:MAG: class I SAM-dependent methyltransferase [Stagnimonas sp.]|nr:class I SAM-dependent methyltransferase [Stagnimonas sp.]